MARRGQLLIVDSCKDVLQRLALADHMNRFIAGDRTPSSPE